MNFEHGPVIPDAFANFKTKIKIGLPEGKNCENENGPVLKLRAKSDHLTYTSTVPSLRGQRYDPYYSTYIGLRNKEDGTIKLIEVEEMTLGAKVKPPQTRNTVLLQAKLDDSKDDAKKQAAAAKKHLVTEFGQSKGQRIYAQADRMAIEAENLTEKLSKAAESVSQDAIMLPNQVISEVKLAPPCNRSGT